MDERLLLYLCRDRDRRTRHMETLSDTAYMKGYIQIKNVREVNGWIGEELTTTDKNARKMMADVALVIMDTAKRIAPVVTGRYRSSIHIEYGSDTEVGVMNKGSKSISGEVWDQNFSQSPGPGEIFVGTNVVYAPEVEERHQTMEKATNEGQWYLTKKMNRVAARR